MPSSEASSEGGAANVTEHFAQHLVSARAKPLPPAVLLEAKHHILDTIAAAVSGLTLLPGKLALGYAKSQGGNPEATVVGLPVCVNAANAAFANAIMAHADESDDSHPNVAIHPGCAVVPSALAMAEKNDLSGETFLRAVVAGYDAGVRMAQALGRNPEDSKDQATRRAVYHLALANVFGAVSAACTASALNVSQVRAALWYAAQQASGLASWESDPDHVGKACSFAGLPARNGVTAVNMVEAGFTAPQDVFDGRASFFASVTTGHDSSRLLREWGTQFEIARTGIKKYPVGGPLQAPLAAFLSIMDENELDYREIARIIVYTPFGDPPLIGKGQAMADLNLRYLLAAAALDKRISFEAAHDARRMRDTDILDMAGRIEVNADESISTRPSPHEGIVQVWTKDGRALTNRPVGVPGGKEAPSWYRIFNYTGKGRPPDTAEIVEKVRDLMQVTLSPHKASVLIDALLNVESVRSVKALRPLLQP